MAHQIDLSNGIPAIAYVGDAPLWHGLGQSLERNSPIEVWVKQAGFDWDILQSEALYQSDDIQLPFPGKQILFRSDNKFPLGIVSDTYKVVQPKEVLEFFRDIVSDTGMYIDTAGVLFEGKKFWAMANTGNSLILKNGDRINGNLLLTTSCDGTNATTASFVSTRVVCNNTLQVALQEQTGKVRVTHRQVFDANLIKQKLGVIDESWDTFKDNILTLQNISLTDRDVRQFVNRILAEDPANITHAETLGINKVVDIYSHRGMGHELGKDTAYGVLNAFTEYVDWHGSQHSKSTKFWNAAYGEGSKLKTEVFGELLKLAA